MKSILLGTDLTANLSPAWERAIYLAKKNQANLHIVHIVDGSLPESLAQSQKNNATENINNRINQINLDGVKSINVQVIIGSESKDFVIYAREIGASLIVIGVRKRLFESAFRGTTSEEIIRFSEVPVLVVKNPEIDDYKRIAIGMDFSVYSRLALEFALELAPDAQFYLIHAYQDSIGDMLFSPDARLKQKEDDLKRFKTKILNEMDKSITDLHAEKSNITRIVKQGKVRQVIRQSVEQLKPDLIVLGTHGRTGIGYSFLGSVAQDILGKPPCDAIAVKAW